MMIRSAWEEPRKTLRYLKRIPESMAVLYTRVSGMTGVSLSCQAALTPLLRQIPRTVTILWKPYLAQSSILPKIKEQISLIYQKNTIFWQIVPRFKLMILPTAGATSWARTALPLTRRLHRKAYIPWNTRVPRSVSMW